MLRWFRFLDSVHVLPPLVLIAYSVARTGAGSLLVWFCLSPSRTLVLPTKGAARIFGPFRSPHTVQAVGPWSRLHSSAKAEASAFAYCPAVSKRKRWKESE